MHVGEFVLFFEYYRFQKIVFNLHIRTQVDMQGVGKVQKVAIHCKAYS